MRNATSLLMLGLFFLLQIGSTSSRAGETWKAGIGRAKITPPQPMPMAGYASRGASHATGKLQELWAKSLVLEDARGRRCVLVTLDLCGIDAPLSERVLSKMHALQLRRDQVMLACSHTHSGPVVAGNLRPMHYMMFTEADQKRVDEYANFLESQIETCVRAALANLAPAELTYGHAEESFATNRRNNPEKDVPTLRSEGKLKGPVDHSVPILQVRRSNRPIAIVFGYACHCTTLDGMDWSGDYAGFAQDSLEQAIPDCQAMFWAGCGADQNPIPRRTIDLARQYGERLAKAVQNKLSDSMKPVSAQLTTQGRLIPIPFGELPTREKLESELRDGNKYIAARAKTWLNHVDSGKSLPTTYDYPITCWKLGGEINWVSLGGEVVVDYALMIKGLPNAKPTTWVTAYANDVMAYIPSRRVLSEGGYEGGGAMVYYGQPTIWAPEIESGIMQEVERQLAAAE